MIKKYCLFLLLMALPFLTASAGVSYSLDPDQLRIVVPPGGSQTRAIKIYTHSSEAVGMKIYVQDWVYNEKYDGRRDFFPANTTAYSAVPWLTVTPSELIIPPYGTGTVSIVARVPPEAEGSRYAVVFVETSFINKKSVLSAPPANTATGNFSVRLGSILYVDARKTVKRSAELGVPVFSRDPKGKKYILSIPFENNGNTDAIANGTFHIMNAKGKIFARSKFSRSFTLSGDSAATTGAWVGTLPQGKYTILATIGLSSGEEKDRIAKGTSSAKEAVIEIGEDGEIIAAGEFK